MKLRRSECRVRPKGVAVGRSPLASFLIPPGLTLSAQAADLFHSRSEFTSESPAVKRSKKRSHHSAKASFMSAIVCTRRPAFAAAKSVDLPELATESTVDAKKLKEALPSVYEALDPDPRWVWLRSDRPLRRILKNPPCTRWREFFRKTERWLVLRDARNRSVHEFEPITGKEFNEEVCHPLRLKPSELAEALREMLR